ncbi:Hypothetical protein D9617_19g102260 [Elsinoe fawcettii]|nr:Hypothetical protein D9617_19g102260 [Elsinoe fawcettii]
MADLRHANEALPLSPEEAIPLTVRGSLDYGSDEESDIEFTSELDIVPRNNNKWMRMKTVLVEARSLCNLGGSMLASSAHLPDETPLLGHLEGLRGYAAFCAFRSIFTSEVQDEEGTKDPSFSWLPSHESSIALFLVISGYVLSHKFVVSDQSSFCYGRLISSLIRRWFRLYLPFLLATFLAVPLIYYRLVPTTAHPSLAQAQSGLFLQYGDWLSNSLASSNPFAAIEWHDTSTSPTHYGSLFWILQLQLRGSIVLFIHILITTRSTRSSRRVLFTVLLLPVLHYWDATYISLFLYGFILANISPSAAQSTKQPELPTTSRSASVDLPRQDSTQDLEVLPCISKKQGMKSYLKTTASMLLRPLETRTPCLLPDPGITALVLLLGLSFLLTLQPATSASQQQAVPFPWSVFRTWTQDWSAESAALFFPGLGAAGLVFCVERMKILKKLASSSVGRTMGRLGTGVFWGHLFVFGAGMGLEGWQASVKGVWDSGFGDWVVWVVVCGIAAGVGWGMQRVDKWLQRGVKRVESGISG